MAPIDTPEAVKPKKEKKDKSAKKRAREEEAAIEERKHKKSKSVAATSPEPEQAADTTDPQAKDQKKQKKKKKDKTDVVEDAPVTETPVVEDEAAQRKREKKEKKRKQKLEEANGSSNAAPPATENDAQQEEDKPQSEKKDKKKKKDKKHTEPVVEQQQQQREAADPDAMEVDSDPKPAPPKSNKIHQPSDIPSSPQFPFYQQTVSLYEPIFPNGWAKPITGCETQHLRHLRNRYVPSLRGVLLDYENITLGEVPGRKGAARDDESPTLLTSKAEFGGAFGWMTADVTLFVPSRGAWMEGSVNLQTEGHIGVVCFGKFNASIEARRLPPSWKWVSDDENGVFDESASVVTGAVPDEHGVVRQIHSTGYWVDEAGDKVAGKTRFRIRNFDVGISGDSTYLSLQGTMLDRDSEKKLVAAEAKDAKERRARRGGGKQLKRTVPDFSMTKFDYVEEEGQDQQQAHDVQQALELPEGADGGDLATETE